MAGGKKSPIDPLTGPTSILEGRIVTMNAADTVIPSGRLYIKAGDLIAVQDSAAPPPAGFDGVAVTQTAGTLYPGLIELHNHLSYNALRLWAVPKKFSNRDQWGGIPEYRRRVSGPMTIIGETPSLLPALVRYVETKSLVAGVTTTQGIALFSNAGVRRYYRGIVRNVEATDEAVLPEATDRIADVDVQTAAKFLERLKKQNCFLLHLSEGLDAVARKHFLALQIKNDRWAITPQLAGIHAAGLTAADFKIYGARGAAMVWSPMSNLLLYGGTAQVAAAKSAGVRIGLGPDWSPTGSKNLLGELKVAKLWSDHENIFTPRELLAMVTRTAADILGWGAVLGSLEPGKRADVTVVAGTAGDPFTHLFSAHEGDIALVLINGVPRFGTPALFTALKVSGETVKIGSASRRLFLKQDTQDPQVGAISLSDATAALKAALHKLPALAKQLENPKPALRARVPASGAPVWRLALDEIMDSGESLRPRLPLGHVHTGARALAGSGTLPLSQVVEPLMLDPLSVAGDAEFLSSIRTQKNLPPWLAQGLIAAY
jgi:cytosine/adenosine deaminase-related metal-dependent hydrolase